MSRVLAHFAIGAIMTTFLIHFLFRNLEYKLSGIVLGGLWGLIPDLYAIVPFYTGFFQQLAASRLADVFWFHRTIDQLEDGAGSPSVAIALAVLLWVVVAATEWYCNIYQDI